MTSSPRLKAGDSGKHYATWRNPSSFEGCPSPKFKRDCAKARRPLATRYAPSGGFNLCRFFKDSSINIAWLSGRARIHSTSQRGSLYPTGTLTNCGSIGGRPAPSRFPPLIEKPEPTFACCRRLGGWRDCLPSLLNETYWCKITSNEF